MYLLYARKENRRKFDEHFYRTFCEYLPTKYLPTGTF